MSINYTQELVRALMQERIFEAKTARLAKQFDDERRVAPVDTLVSRLTGLVARRSAAPTPAACPNC